MSDIKKTLEELMKIDGAIGAVVADWESGMSLGHLGGQGRIDLEVAAAGNCQVVKAKMALPGSFDGDVLIIPPRMELPSGFHEVT